MEKPLVHGISIEKINAGLPAETPEKKLSKSSSGEKGTPKLTSHKLLYAKKREPMKSKRSFSVSDLKRQLSDPAFNRRYSYESLMVNSHSSVTEGLSAQQNFHQPSISSHPSEQSSPLSSSCPSPLNFHQWGGNDNLHQQEKPFLKDEEVMELDHQVHLNKNGSAFMPLPSLNNTITTTNTNNANNYFLKSHEPINLPQKPIQQDFIITSQQQSQPLSAPQQQQQHPNQHNPIEEEDDVLVQVQYFNNYFQQTHHHNPHNPTTNINFNNQNNFILAINPDTGFHNPTHYFSGNYPSNPTTTSSSHYNPPSNINYNNNGVQYVNQNHLGYQNPIINSNRDFNLNSNFNTFGNWDTFVDLELNPCF